MECLTLVRKDISSKKSNNMKIVNILGGLGNQMFEYAMYLALKEAHPEEDILLCRRCYNGYSLHNGYELERIFGIKAQEANFVQLSKVAYPFFNYKTWQIMHHFFHIRKCMTLGTSQIPFDYKEVSKKGDLFYDGYWQNEKYFLPIRNKVLASYTFPDFNDEYNMALANRLKDKRAVSCHVRRGDYLKNPVMYVCNNTYYEKAIYEIDHIVDPDMYIIFSDDIQWCQDNMISLFRGKEVVFVDWNKGLDSYKDMQLMSLCHYNIIANSSFSWWGAWLNNHTDKIVLAPEKWMNKPIVNNPICDSWKLICNSK